MTQADLFKRQLDENHPIFCDLSYRVVRCFWDYHQENPEVYELFKQYANDLYRRGFRHYGAKAIMERIRWHMTVDRHGDEFKINNNYVSCYVRLLQFEEPKFDGFFQTRSMAMAG